MSEPMIIDAESTLEDRVEYLEQATRQLLEGQKAVLEHLREALTAVTEISQEE